MDNLESNFPIDCTGDVVTGDEILFSEAVFGGALRRPKFLGERQVAAKVIKDSYGNIKQQHTFTIEVIASSGFQALKPGKVTRRKGRNIYRNGTSRKSWVDESARQVAVDEKHLRGDAARSDRQIRRECFA